MTKKVGNTVFYGSLAEVADSISEEEMLFYDIIDDITDQIVKHMEKKNITKSDLANHLNASRSWVSQALSGDKNITMKTLASVLHNIEANVKVKVVDSEDSFQWIGISTSTRRQSLHQPYNKREVANEYNTFNPARGKQYYFQAA